MHKKLFLVVVLFFIALDLNALEKIEPLDTKIIPQDASFFAKNIIDVNYSNQTKKNIESRFKKFVTKPWHSRFEKKYAQKYTKSADNFQKCFDRNFRKYSSSQIAYVKSNAKGIKSLQLNGILVKNSDERVAPTDLACIKKDLYPGVEYFDNYQNSRLYIGSPVKIGGISKDKKWYLVHSHETSYGWVRASDIALVKNRDIHFFKNAKLGVILNDKNNLKLGMFFPIKDFIDYDARFFIPKKGKDGFVSWGLISLNKEYFAQIPLNFTRHNVSRIANNLLRKPYGWGGSFDRRDCSATTRDFFTTFGIYLRRNSKSQIDSDQAKRICDISGKNNKERIDILNQCAVPFKTLVYLPGHIGLYIGSYNLQGKRVPLILHNIWAVKTANNNGYEGRRIINKSIISTLEVGKEVGKDALLMLDRVTKFSVF
jgi:hypothetical protein